MEDLLENIVESLFMMTAYKMLRDLGFEVETVEEMKVSLATEK